MKLSKKSIISAVASALLLQLSMAHTGARLREFFSFFCNVHNTSNKDDKKMGRTLKTSTANTCGIKPLQQAEATNSGEFITRFLKIESPLYMAVFYGHIESVQKLIEADTEINATNDDGVTPLHWAAKNGHTKITQLLIEAGAIIDATNNDGWTPLHWATFNGHTEAVRELIKRGANLTTEIKRLRLLQNNPPLLRECEALSEEYLQAVSECYSFFLENEGLSEDTVRHGIAPYVL